MAKLEAEILKLETRQKELTAVLETPEVYRQPGQAMSLNREWSENSTRLEHLSRQWEQAAEQALATGGMEQRSDGVME